MNVSVSFLVHTFKSGCWEDNVVSPLGKQFNNIQLMNFKGTFTLCPVTPFLEIIMQRSLGEDVYYLVTYKSQKTSISLGFAWWRSG